MKELILPSRPSRKWPAAFGTENILKLLSTSIVAAQTFTLVPMKMSDEQIANLLRRRDGMELMEAVKEAGRRRLRPILMTALTTIFGMLPMAIGLGEGSEVQAPLARTVIGGLTSSTFITLVFIPVVYSLIEQRRQERKNRFNNGQSFSEPAN